MIQEQAHAPRTLAAVLCTLQSGRQVKTFVCNVNV